VTQTAGGLFTSGTYCAVELNTADIARLERFFDDNPAYFLAVSGERASPDDARDEIEGAERFWERCASAEARGQPSLVEGAL